MLATRGRRREPYAHTVGRGKRLVGDQGERHEGVVSWGRRAVLRAAVLGPLAAACAAPPAPPSGSAVAASGATAAGAAPSGSVAPGAPLSAAARPTGEVAHADTGRGEVALTFHGAGDETLARRVLNLLHDHGAAGTVLAVGTWLRQYPDAGRMVVGLGHELGNHTWSHPNLAALDENGMRVEIERCRDRIAAATGGPGAAHDVTR